MPDNRWMIEDVAGVPGVQHVVVLSRDGLKTATSEGTAEEVADRVAAACSGIFSLARGLASEFGSGNPTVRQSMTEFDGAFLFMRAAGEGSVLAVVTGPSVDPALIAHQMQTQVGKLGRGLSTPTRKGREV